MRIEEVNGKDDEAAGTSQSPRSCGNDPGRAADIRRRRAGASNAQAARRTAAATPMRTEPTSTMAASSRMPVVGTATACTATAGGESILAVGSGPASTGDAINSAPAHTQPTTSLRINTPGLAAFPDSVSPVCDLRQRHRRRQPLLQGICHGFPSRNTRKRGRTCCLSAYLTA